MGCVGVLARGEGRCISGRDVLRAGGLGGLAAGAGAWAGAGGPAAEAASAHPAFGRARACLFVFLGGGPSHLDTFDPRPDAPEEVRGEFRAIASRVPGLHLCEHLPGLARRAGRLTVVRSLTHDDPGHAGAAYCLFTGRTYPRPAEQGEFPSREHDPHLGSILAPGRGPAADEVPPFVVVAGREDGRAGRHAGRLGCGFDPLVVRGGPGDPGPAHAAPAGGPLARVLDRGGEPERVRDRYGRGHFGRSLLLGRRLIEAGARFVQVDWTGVEGAGWDTHADGFRALREDLLPPADRALSALLDDTAASGLLDETLVVVSGEFGRAPAVAPALGGRGHWPHAFSALMAGAGLPGGRAYGASDRLGAYPADRPLSPGRLAATVLFALGAAPDVGDGPDGGTPAFDLLG